MANLPGNLHSCFQICLYNGRLKILFSGEFACVHINHVQRLCAVEAVRLLEGQQCGLIVRTAGQSCTAGEMEQEFPSITFNASVRSKMTYPPFFSQTFRA